MECIALSSNMYFLYIAGRYRITLSHNGTVVGFEGKNLQLSNKWTDFHLNKKTFSFRTTRFIKDCKNKQTVKTLFGTDSKL